MSRRNRKPAEEAQPEAAESSQDDAALDALLDAAASDEGAEEIPPVLEPRPTKAVLKVGARASVHGQARYLNAGDDVPNGIDPEDLKVLEAGGFVSHLTITD